MFGRPPAAVVAVGVVAVPAGVVVVLGVEVVVDARTAIVPCMNGWIVQTYENVPAVANVCDALAPVARIPVSKPLPVAVCLLGPWFVHVTVSPAWIVSVPGENEKSAIPTPGSRLECALAASGIRK